VVLATCLYNCNGDGDGDGDGDGNGDCVCGGDGDNDGELVHQSPSARQRVRVEQATWQYSGCFNHRWARYPTHT
jgi:hypothetical protein